MQAPKSDTSRNPATLSSGTKGCLSRRRRSVSVCVHMCAFDREDDTVGVVLWDYIDGEKIDTFECNE